MGYAKNANCANKKKQKMRNVLSSKVSWFANYNTPTPSGDIEIMALLTSEKYKATIERVRSTIDKGTRDALKATLPAFTPSCVCTYRGQKHVVQHSGLIQFDIDAKENPLYQDWRELMKIISGSPNVAYCGLSVSGRGLWGLIPIAFPDRHKQHFEHLRRYFLSEGITIDKAPSSILSLRGISYDTDAYFNCNAEPVVKYFEAPPHAPTTRLDQYGTSPIWDRYNQCPAFEMVLFKYGWEIHRKDQTKTYFTRPGKSRGVSAEFDQSKGVFYVFTSSTEFEAGKGYTPFAVYAILEHGGNFKEATKAVNQELSLII